MQLLFIINVVNMTLRVVGTNWGHAHGLLLGGCISAIKRFINAQPAAT